MQNKFKKQGVCKQLSGSVLNPEGSGLRLVLTTADMNGEVEGELTLLLKKKWAQTSTTAKTWFANRVGYKLGSIELTAVQSDVWVIHMLCLDKGVVVSHAVSNCLKKVADKAVLEQASVHISNLLVDKIPELKTLVTEAFVERGINVSFYDHK
jgi:hypothetical protein